MVKDRPNGTTHKTAGGFLGTIAYMMIHNNLQKTEEIELIELLFSAGVGISSARIPDVLEPAVHPNHRAFFHSLAFAGVSGYVGFQAWSDLKERRIYRKTIGNQKWELGEFIDIGLIVISASILLHLTMDAFTPKGLPAI